MHPNALLDIATELLREVGKLDMPADVVVSNFFRKNRELGPRERHALAETAYAVLRQRLLYQHQAQSGSGVPAPGAARERRAGPPPGHPGLAGRGDADPRRHGPARAAVAQRRALRRPQ